MTLNIGISITGAIIAIIIASIHYVGRLKFLYQSTIEKLHVGAVLISYATCEWPEMYSFQ